jgi:hypothetical protein
VIHHSSNKIKKVKMNESTVRTYLDKISELEKKLSDADDIVREVAISANEHVEEIQAENQELRAQIQELEQYKIRSLERRVADLED